ncbi:ABC transporter ATP-binding protein [Companilactobacillus kimchiensis]|uniref:ABC transporter ATP-binding protein n=2 Tax=Companilactobacillus kimchiensis TaxID=993692 RepID=A0A0R2LH65_9LACO|nr:ABC transporter ATP-binding protein [Companilactobacillus kimchiensis]
MNIMKIMANKVTKVMGNKGNQIEILHGIDLQTSSGEFLSIIGPSGSGKTTLLKCLSGLVQPTSGTVKIDNQLLNNISERKIAKLRRTKISYIFQSYNLLPALSAFDNIVLPLRLSRQRINKTKIYQLMNSLNFKADLKQLPAELSGGEQQKVAIARALTMKAEIIFADEPTGALDSTSRQIIFDQLRQLADSGVCIVMVTHDIGQAAQTDRALVLNDGQVMAEVNHPTEPLLISAMNETKKAII